MHGSKARTVGCFVVTFDRPDWLRRTIESLLAQTRPPDRILVIDNGSSRAGAEVAALFPSDPVVYRRSGDNLGPAGAAHIACRYFLDEGFEYVLWQDDDDLPLTPDTIERLIPLFQAGDGEKVGAVGAAGTLLEPRTWSFRRLSDHELSGTVEVDYIGEGSQLILRCEALRDAGLPDPDLFFGWESFDLCSRLRESGWKLRIDGDLNREHRVLLRRTHRVPRRRVIPRESGSDIWRSYYDTRNMIHLAHHRFGRPDVARRVGGRALAKAVAAWLRGPAFGWAYSRHQVRAIADGYHSRLGRSVEPPRHPIGAP